MTPTLFDVPRSGHCHRVRLAASLMGVDINIAAVMEMNGQRSGEAFLAINPLGQVPALKDGEFVLSDSLAIIRYLAREYATDAGWIPSNAHDRAHMDQWFGVAAGPVFRGPNVARLVKLFGADRDYEDAVLQSNKLFALLEARLQDHDWLVGTRATLADVACYSYIAVAHEGALDLTPYKHINRWVANMRSLDGFVEMPMAQQDAV